MKGFSSRICSSVTEEKGLDGSICFGSWRETGKQTWSSDIECSIDVAKHGPGFCSVARTGPQP